MENIREIIIFILYTNMNISVYNLIEYLMKVQLNTHQLTVYEYQRIVAI